MAIENSIFPNFISWIWHRKWRIDYIWISPFIDAIKSYYFSVYFFGGKDRKSLKCHIYEIWKITSRHLWSLSASAWKTRFQNEMSGWNNCYLCFILIYFYHCYFLAENQILKFFSKWTLSLFLNIIMSKCALLNGKLNFTSTSKPISWIHLTGILCVFE